MGEDVEHRPPAPEPRREGVVRPLVVEEPGLLPAREVGEVGRPVHRHLDRPVERRPEHRPLGIESLEPPRPSAGVLHHRRHPGDAHQRLDQRRQPHLGPGGVRLHHRHVAEPVDDHPRQPVGLGVRQPVEGRVEQRRPQRQRPRDPPREPAGVDRRRRVRVEQPQRDLGAGIERRRPERPPLGVLERHHRAGRDRPRPPVEHHLVGIVPRRALPPAPAGAQPHDGSLGRLGHRPSMPAAPAAVHRPRLPLAPNTPPEAPARHAPVRDAGRTRDPMARAGSCPGAAFPDRAGGLTNASRRIL